MARKQVIVLLIMLAGAQSALGQLNNRFLYDSYEVNPSDSGHIKFGMDVLTYLRNNEYQNEVIPGYTLFGYQIKPYFSYYPGKHLRFDLGGYFQRDFGDEGFNEIRPILTIKYQYENYSFLFGTLEGAASHRLIEPLYDFENVITQRIEDGIQFRYISDKWFLDTWIDWIHMIQFGDEEQERFNAGISFLGTLLHHRTFDILIPVQLLAHHRGGQIDVSPLPATTFFNSAAGLQLVKTMRTDILRELRFDTYYTMYNLTDPVPDVPYTDGDGLFINVTGALKWFELMLSYWNGNEFYAPFGGRIYQSVSYNFPGTGYMEEKRELLFFRCLYERELTPGLTLAFRFEPLFDLNNQLFEHSESIYLRFSPSLLLNKNKSW